MEGVLLESDGFVKRQIDRVREDENVRAVVVRIDSPGGAVTASDYLYHHLKELREQRDIPLVVSMGAWDIYASRRVGLDYPPRGEVVAVGPGARDDDGERIAIACGDGKGLSGGWIVWDHRTEEIIHAESTKNPAEY